MKLTKKQKLFCNEYLKDFNATRSYKVAYDTKNTMSDDVAASNGSRLLRNDKIQRYLSKRIKDRRKRLEVSQDLVVEQLAKIALADVTEVINAKGQYKVTVKDTNQIPDELKYAIKSIKPSRSGIEVEFYDKLKALELLGKHLGMFTEKLNVTGNMGVNIIDDISCDKDEKC